MDLPKRGDRIRAEGRVLHADRMSVSVKWDNGRALALIPGEDTWEVLT